MGQAFDESGNTLAEAFGATKREVLDKLEFAAPAAHEVRIRQVEAQSEMPRYRCHKEVHALRIDGVQKAERGDLDPESVLLLVESPFAGIRVSGDWLTKHAPHVGGYYVVYEDGYTSFSPATAFEGGYTRI